MGGRAACQKQRVLRTRCFDTGDWDVDLTHDAWDWRSMLRGLARSVREDIVGPGITKFAFRLLRNVRDHNWSRLDSGENHVFEITRVDGSTCHLHFHKNGKLDPPTFVVPETAAASNRGVAQPARTPLGSDADQPIYTASDIFSTNANESDTLGK